MTEKVQRCMVCGKESDSGKTICQQCEGSIRGEAVGKRNKIAKNAEKEMKRQGEKLPQK